MYIGEAENVLDRLAQHLRDYQSGKALWHHGYTTLLKKKGVGKKVKIKK